MPVIYFTNQLQEAYKEPEKIKAITDNIRALPERTGTLSSEQEKRFHQIFDKLNSGAECNYGTYRGRDQDLHLEDQEREELAGLLKQMGTSHIITWRMRSLGPCSPSSWMRYDLSNLHENASKAAVQAVRTELDRLKNNGVSHYSIGKLRSTSEEESPEKTAIYFKVDTSTTLNEEDAYRQGGDGFFCRGNPVRTPESIGPFPVENDESAFEIAPLPSPIDELKH